MGKKINLVSVGLAVLIIFMMLTLPFVSHSGYSIKAFSLISGYEVPSLWWSINDAEILKLGITLPLLLWIAGAALSRVKPGLEKLCVILATIIYLIGAFLVGNLYFGYEDAGVYLGVGVYLITIVSIVWVVLLFKKKKTA